MLYFASQIDIIFAFILISRRRHFICRKANITVGLVILNHKSHISVGYYLRLFGSVNKNSFFSA